MEDLPWEDLVFEWKDYGDYERLHSVCGFKLKLHRETSGHLVKSFLPAAVGVVVSFICFLVGNDEVAARIAVMMILIYAEIILL